MSELRMDIPYLRSLMINHKAFLKNLYTGNNLLNFKTIENANDRQINIVIRILHLIANGVIPMKAAQFKIVKGSKRFKLLREKFESSAAFNKNLNSKITDKTTRVRLLKQFASLYPHLFYTLFNEQ